MARVASKQECELFINTINKSIITFFPYHSIVGKYNREKFNRTIDLHGYSIMEAYNITNNYINAACEHQIKHVTIITGKSGVIKYEFDTWLDNNKNVLSYREKNSGGAYTIKLNIKF